MINLMIIVIVIDDRSIDDRHDDGSPMIMMMIKRFIPHEAIGLAHHDQLLTSGAK